MKTIRDTLNDSIKLLKTNLVLNHLKACELIFMDLSTIKGFDQDVLHSIAYYQKYLLEKHKSIKKVGIIEKIVGIVYSWMTKKRLIEFLNRCQSKKFDSGDKYLQEIFQLIRKGLK